MTRRKKHTPAGLRLLKRTDKLLVGYYNSYQRADRPEYGQKVENETTLQEGAEEYLAKGGN